MSLVDKLRPGFRLLGPTTKETTLSSGERVAFAKEALESVVERTNHQFIPSAVEHLSYLPPIGRIAEAELIEDQGDYWLAIRDEPLAPGTCPDLTLPHAADSGAAKDASSLSVKLATEPRNFERADFDAIRDQATTEVGEISLHSELPPIVWHFGLFIGGLGVVGAGAFVKEFYKKLGAAAADDFIAWLKPAAQQAKEAEREQLAEFRLETKSGISVIAICPFNPEAQHTLEQLADAMNHITDVAAFVWRVEGGEAPDGLRQVAFIWEDEAWHLAWWATDTASFVTQWLEANAPDPSRFLGELPPTLRLLGPYLPGLPGASTPDAVGDAGFDVASQDE